MLRIKESLISNNKSLKNTFAYDGRASREEFYLFFWFQILFAICITLLILVTTPFLNLLPPAINNIITGILSLPLIVYILSLLFTFTSLSVRRLHDLGMSLKNWYLLPFVAHKKGSMEPNAWGQSPRRG